MLLSAPWGDIPCCQPRCLSLHLQAADCVLVLAGNWRSVPWQPWQVFAYTLHIVTTMPRLNIITHSVNWTRSINMITWSFSAHCGTRVLGFSKSANSQPPALYSFQYCLAYLPFLPCIWRKPIRFKMCLLKDYLCWFPPSFLLNQSTNVHSSVLHFMYIYF